MPDEVDSWPVEWSMGWLLERAMELKYDAEKWKGQPIGFGLEDPDWDPAFGDAQPWLDDLDGEVVGDGGIQ